MPLYTQTAAIWIRGHLTHQYGVNLDTIRWVQGAVEKSGTPRQAKAAAPAQTGEYRNQRKRLIRWASFSPGARSTH